MCADYGPEPPRAEGRGLPRRGGKRRTFRTEIQMKSLTFGVASALLTVALVSGSLQAQGRGAPPPAPAPAQDFSQVQIKTTKIGPSFYTLEGQGGTIGA